MRRHRHSDNEIFRLAREGSLRNISPARRRASYSTGPGAGRETVELARRLGLALHLAQERLLGRRLSGRPLSRSSSSRDSPPTFWRWRAIATWARAIEASTSSKLSKLTGARSGCARSSSVIRASWRATTSAIGVASGSRSTLRLRRRLEPIDAVRVARDEERALDLADQLDHAQVAREQLHELQHRDHDAARVQVIRARADHAAGVDEQPQERPVLRIDPRHRQVLDVGEPAVAAAPRARARARS